MRQGLRRGSTGGRPSGHHWQHSEQRRQSPHRSGGSSGASCCPRWPLCIPSSGETSCVCDVGVGWGMGCVCWGHRSTHSTHLPGAAQVRVMSAGNGSSRASFSGWGAGELATERLGGFTGGSVVKNLPVNAGDTSSIPGLGTSHMLQIN